ncbi:hypothetical protein FB451DRAFT_1193226 [Mycena latifolia]|nr:hypothetical protein FB451DRAFT_1193226 [Mycena latifolia]
MHHGGVDQDCNHQIVLVTQLCPQSHVGRSVDDGSFRIFHAPEPLGRQGRHPHPPLYHLEDLVSSESVNPSAFSSVTHLEISWGPRQHDTWKTHSLFPQLTHLALHQPAYIPYCRPLLDKSKSLCAVIILNVPPDRYKEGLGALAEDPRFVMMPLVSSSEDWQNGALTGEDYWTRADAFIAKRRSGAIPRNTFFVGQGTG